MTSIEVNGTQVEEESEIREQVVQFYTSLYQENEAWRPGANGLPFEVIGVEEQQVLERRFEKDEILQVIKDLQGTKPLGWMVIRWLFFSIAGELFRRTSWGFLRTFMSMVSLRNPLMLLSLR